MISLNLIEIVEIEMIIIMNNKYIILKTEMTRIEIMEHRTFRNNEYYNSCIRQLSRSTVFFPTDNHLEFTCRTSNHLETETNTTTDRTVCNFKQSSTEISPVSGRSNNKD